MKTIKIFILSLLFVSNLQAQSNNVFWESDFWKTNPTIETIEQKITEGHSSIALDQNGFDAVVNAIFAKAPNTVIKYLLSKKGNFVNKLTHDKRTYVFWAAYKGNIELVKHLIDNNARLDLKDSHNFSPLTFAAVAGQTNTEIYDLFINNGLNIKNDKDEHGANALLLAIPNLKNLALVDYFVSKGLSLKSVDNYGNGAFNYVAKKGNIEMLNVLMKKGVSFKGLNDNHGNAMLFASKGSRGKYNSLEFFNYLEGLGIVVNITNNDGVTPLHNLAYGIKDLEIINYFVSKGVDINQVDKDGNTILMNASRRNSLKIISKISETTKEISHVNKIGHSALTLAMSNTSQVIDFLIKKGADVNVLDTKGNNLMYYLIKSYKRAKQNDFESKLDILYKNNLDITEIQKNGNSLFHLAAASNNLDLIKYVNTIGINVNDKNKEGLTALHIATMKAKNVAVISYLLSIGARKDIKTDFEESVYDLAKENELLGKNNIDINFLK